jgi:hypothetical protein
MSVINDQLNGFILAYGNKFCQVENMTFIIYNLLNINLYRRGYQPHNLYCFLLTSDD